MLGALGLAQRIREWALTWLLLRWRQRDGMAPTGWCGGERCRHWQQRGAWAELKHCTIIGAVRVRAQMRMQYHGGVRDASGAACLAPPSRCSMAAGSLR
jgi:hypothetical protein